jgi:Amt family ammonium transporter
VAVAATLAYSAAVTLILVKAIALFLRVRTNAREEGLGLDFTQHGEEAYSRGEGAILLLDGGAR